MVVEQAKRDAYRRPEAAERMGVSTDTIDRLIADGSLKSIKIRAARLIPASEIEAYIARQLEENG